MKIELPELAAINQKVSQLVADVSQLKENSGAGYDLHDRLVRVSEAAEILGVNATTIRSYIKDGLLKAYQTPNGGGQTKVWVSHLHKLVVAK
jgi:excisionase family DNA binding protein